MHVAKSWITASAVTLTLVVTGCAQGPVREGSGSYTVDAAWPKPLPNNWTLGQVAGIAVEAPRSVHRARNAAWRHRR